jgi:hypothetical protein
MQGPSPDLRDRLLAQVASRPAPRRAELIRRRVLLLVLAAAPIVLMLATKGIAWTGRPESFVIVSAALAAIVALAGTWWAISPGRSTLGRPRPFLRMVAAWLPAVLLLVAGVAGLIWPETQTGFTLDPHVHIPCLVTTLLLAAAPFGVMMYLERHSDPVDPTATGAVLGAAAGSWAAVGMTLHCGHSDVLHLGLAHILPVLALAGLGALVGAKVLGIHADRKTSN